MQPNTATLFMKGKMDIKEFNELQDLLVKSGVGVSKDALNIGCVEIANTKFFAPDDKVSMHLAKCGIDSAYIYGGSAHSLPSVCLYDVGDKRRSVYTYSADDDEFLLPLWEAEDDEALVAARGRKQLFDVIRSYHGIQPIGEREYLEFHSSKPDASSVRELGVEAVTAESSVQDFPSFSFETSIYSDRTYRKWFRKDGDYQLLREGNRFSIDDNRTG